MRAYVEYKRNNRIAAAHLMDTKIRFMFKAWRVGVKLDKALALWTGNTLNRERARRRGRAAGIS